MITQPNRINNVGSPILRIKCWCDKWVILYKTSQGDYNLTHPLPACQQFIKEGVAEFLHNLRKRYENNSME